MKHIKLFESFSKLNEEVTGAKRFTNIQNISIGELHRFAEVGSLQELKTFPVGTLANMRDLSSEVLDNIKSFSNGKGLIRNVCFPNPEDKSKFLIFYTTFDGWESSNQSFIGNEKLIHEDMIFNNTDIPTSKLNDIIDGWNRHS